MGETLPRVPGGAPVRTLRVKMVLLGSSGVGKSSLAVRFSKDQLRDSSPTVGCAYLTRVLYLEDITLRFEIWDTAGQEKYHSVTPLYYRGAHAALVVYNICKKETFVRAQVWLRELEKQYVPGSTVVWLIGNKEDLSQNREVSVQEGQNLAQEKRFVLHRDIGFVRRPSQRAAAGCGVYESIGEQEGGLSEWHEMPLVDLRHPKSFNPFASCCRVGP